MKKSFVAVALVMGLGTTVAFAENLTSGVETVMAVNDFTPIEVKDLPAAVTEAIAKNFAESTVKEAAVEAAEDGSKTYQVVLTDKEGTESTVIGIFLEVSHDIDGSMMFLLDLESGHYLADKLLMKENVVHEQMEVFDEMELSALKEVGNIITASYLSALASMTNLTILPSVPYICVDMAAAILSVPAIEFGLVGDRALLIETEICADVAIRGYFILMPEQESYYKILSALGLSL